MTKAERCQCRRSDVELEDDGRRRCGDLRCNHLATLHRSDGCRANVWSTADDPAPGCDPAPGPGSTGATLVEEVKAAQAAHDAPLIPHLRAAVTAALDRSAQELTRRDEVRAKAAEAGVALVADSAFDAVAPGPDDDAAEQFRRGFDAATDRAAYLTAPELAATLTIRELLDELAGRLTRHDDPADRVAIGYARGHLAHVRDHLAKAATVDLDAIDDHQERPARA